jgi:hypothetical protein
VLVEGACRADPSAVTRTMKDEKQIMLARRPSVDNVLEHE